MDILDKIVKKFSESGSSGDTAVVYTKQDFDIQLDAIRGLTKCMKLKLYNGPGNIAKRCFFILVGVLDNIYERPVFLECTGDIRLGKTSYEFACHTHRT